MTEGITKIEGKKATDTTYSFFDKNGKECKESDLYFAFSMNAGGSSFYRVFCSTEGRIIDPVDHPMENPKTIDKMTKCPKYKSRSVNEKCFTNYIKYLQIKRRPLLSFAEREL